MKIYYTESDRFRMETAKKLGWRFITKVDGVLEGIPPEKEAVDKNIQRVPNFNEHQQLSQYEH